jgi:hypothetical protein
MRLRRLMRWRGQETQANLPRSEGILQDEQVSGRIAKSEVEARRERVADIAIDHINRCTIGDDSPAFGTAHQPDGCDGNDANERKNGRLPGNIHLRVLQVRPVQTRPERLWSLDTPIMARSRNTVCDLRHSKIAIPAH